MTATEIAIARRLWLEGCDTLTIARHLRMHEAKIYNYLPMIRGVR